MKRNIIAGLAVILAIWASVHMIRLDMEAHKLKVIHNIIEKSDETIHVTSEKNIVIHSVFGSGQSGSQSAYTAEQNKVKALQASAGAITPFKVSKLYTQNCSSCHGDIAQGEIGPKLMGRSKKFILTNLLDFKSGVKKNYVMYGLLQNLSKEQLTTLATEISTFQLKYNKAKGIK